MHNLRVITEATASRDGDLRRVVDAGDATLDALARNDEPLQALAGAAARDAARGALDAGAHAAVRALAATAR